MTRFHLVLRSIWFYRRTHAGALLGAALASMILAGALGVGDAVRHSLLDLTRTRLGKTAFVVATQEQFFQADLADRLSGERTQKVAPVLILEGVLTTPDESQRVHSVQVVGVDDRFWALSPEGTTQSPIEPGSCRINPVLSDRLNLQDEQQRVVLRLRKPNGLPADMTLASREHDTWSRLLTVSGVQEPDAFGYFSLRATQRLSPTIFVSRSWLAEQLDIADRANTLLVPEGEETVASLQQQLDDIWQFGDVGIQLAKTADGIVELTSRQVFIPPHIAAATKQAFPNAHTISTYFMNRIEAGERTTPYSFASAPGPPRIPEDLKENEVIINDWLATDLGATRGTDIRITYYAVDTGGKLQEQSETFRVADILPVAEVAKQDRHLVPSIPGLSDAENCRDWDPGIPIDLEQIRDKDEAYWDAYGPLPKLYFTHTTAERLWANRFGFYTAIRFPENTIDEVHKTLHAQLNAQMLGLVPQPIRETGLQASRNAVDFGQLFVGLSFFLIVATILLTVLLFSFGITQRMEETGTLLAIGFDASRVRRQLWIEGILLAATGAILGGAAAQGYNHLMLWGLRTIWYGAVQTTIFIPHIRIASILTGMGITCIAAGSGMAWILRQYARYTIHALQRKIETGDASTHTGRRWLSGAIGILAVLVASGIVLLMPAGQGHAAAGAFFGSGSLLLIGILLLAHSGMTQLQNATMDILPSRGKLALQTIALRRGRSLTCLALMAIGVFLVMAVAANRKGTITDPTNRSSGTGGWLFWGQTTLPITHDLNTEAGRKQYGLQDKGLDMVSFTQLRYREGDDASCLNLNLVSNPPLLGIDPNDWQERNPFQFATLSENVDPNRPWLALADHTSANTVPAFADMADITWGLGISVGDTLDYTDEKGQPFKIQIVGGLTSSILQGNILIAEDHFTERFPSLGGHRVLLMDVPPEQATQVSEILTTRLGDRGLACTSTAQRLAEFYRVENTYLSIFMMLGGFGCLIGSVGLGIVAARNILERRSELALLRAVGYSRRQLHWLVFLEHAALVIAGVAGGTFSAALAVTPALMAPGTAIPWHGLLATLTAIICASLLWIWIAIRMAMHGTLISALRSE